MTKPSHPLRRTLTAALVSTLAATAATAPSTPARAAPAASTTQSATPAQPAAATDWSVAVIDSTMKRYTPATIGGWSYPVGLYLYGQYLVYQRTHNPAYL